MKKTSPPLVSSSSSVTPLASSSSSNQQSELIQSLPPADSQQSDLSHSLPPSPPLSADPQQSELSQSLPPHKRKSPPLSAVKIGQDLQQSELSQSLPPYKRTSPPLVSSSSANPQQPELSQSLPKSPPLAPHSSYDLTDFELLDEDYVFGRASLNKSGDDEAKRWKSENENNDTMSSFVSPKVREPIIVVQTTSDIDDEYTWWMYGQKFVKGNHNHEVPAPCGSGSYPAVNRPSDNSNTTSTVYNTNSPSASFSSVNPQQHELNQSLPTTPPLASSSSANPPLASSSCANPLQSELSQSLPPYKRTSPPLASSSSGNPQQPDLSQSLPPYKRTSPPLVSSSSANPKRPKLSQSLSSYHLTDLERFELIGECSYGTVYKVVHPPSGNLYAIKAINLPLKNSARRQIRRNIENLRDLDNVNLVKCHHIWDDGWEIKVLLEYMDKGSLKGIHINNEPALADLSRQIISGIQYLHHKKKCVPWLMPSKLLLNSRNQIKINVVGVSKRNQSNPERINCDLDHYDGCAADIWSLGVTILELYMGCSPFVGDSLPPQAPPTASPEFREFISLCLQKDPTKRWNADQLLSHPFVTQILLPSSGYNNKSLLSSVLNSPPFGGWNVFLSFSGVDTRYNFTSHLYSALVRHGVPTFMDDTEMEKGPGISDVSTQAIQNSKIYVVVFSENYASSPQCLDQLVEILQCSNSMGRLVLPIYYNIEPSVVRTQSGSFKEAFEQHENHFDVNRLDKWRIALMNVWNLSGYILLNNMSEADIVNQVVDRALLELNPMTLAVARYPVGLNSRVNDITALFSCDSKGVSRTSVHDMGGAGKSITARKTSLAKWLGNSGMGGVGKTIPTKTLHVAQYPVGLDSDVKHITTMLSRDTEECVIRIGIYGMGGVGKTTLAKAVYNQNYHHFQGSCFLANIREVSGTETGLISLQQKLINDVLKCKNINIANVDQGIELIRARICSMKILIVFDDMDDPMPLEFLEGPFAFGSIVLITTRNEDLLDSIKIEARYKVNELGDAESRQLFSQHAFGEDKISHEFTELSQEILQRAGGLPLALEVFGSNLIDLSEEGKICIDKLNQVSSNDVEKKLMISYDALELVDPMLQDIFLDIACFFIAQKKEEVVKKIETCYSYADHNIEFLKKRCLVTFNDKNELGMHDLFRDLGRKIARNNSPDEPGKHSRLWVATDIYEVLKDHKGTESIECIIPWNFDYQNALERVSFSTETFKMMCNLRFLQLEGYLTGSFEQLFEDLRWLLWDRCPLTCLPSEFYPEKLVILELPGSKIRKMFELSMVSQVFENLKTLNLSYSLDLRTLPDFNMFPFLETINLEGCKSLREVHISIGILARLVSLNLHGCVELKGLPDTICNLRALKVINISGCINLKALPIKLGDIESLKEFDAEKINVSRLPDSIECLSNLVQLNLSCNHMNRLPHLSKMKGLEELKLTNCSSLKEIQGLEDLTSIRKLHLGGCSSSLLAYTFTERFFQIYSTFGHQINIYAPSSEFPDWIGQTTISGKRVSLELRPNFLAMIFCFERCLDFETLCDIHVKHTNSNSVRHVKLYAGNIESCIVIVPRSVILVRDSDDIIEFRTRKEILGFHLLYTPGVTSKTAF